MGDLRVEHSITVDAVRVDKGRAVLAEVVEYLDDLVRSQDLLQVELQPVVEWVDFEHVKQV